MSVPYISSHSQDGHPGAWQALSDPVPDGRPGAWSRRRGGLRIIIDLIVPPRPGSAARSRASAPSPDLADSGPRPSESPADLGRRETGTRVGRRRLMALRWTLVALAIAVVAVGVAALTEGEPLSEVVATRGSLVLVPVLIATTSLLVIVTCRTAVDAHAEGFQPAILLRIAVVLGCLALAWPAVLLALATSAPALDVRWRSGRRAGAGVPIRVRRGRRWPCGRGRPGSLRGPAGAWPRTSGPRRSPRAQASRAPIAGAPSVKGARPRSLYHLAARRRVRWLVSERTAPETTAKATTSPSR